jgi:hypothetical protein
MKPRERVEQKRIQLMQEEKWAPPFVAESIVEAYDSMISRLAIVECFFEDKGLMDEFRAWSIQLNRQDKLEVIHGKKS